MNATLIVRRILLAVTAAFLLILALWAISGGVNQFDRVLTFGQGMETVAQLACGLLSVATLVTTWHRRGRAVRRAWAVSLVLTVALSGLVWGPPMLFPALAFAAAALLIAAAVFWALRVSAPAASDSVSSA